MYRYSPTSAYALKFSANGGTDISLLGQVNASTYASFYGMQYFSEQNLLSSFKPEDVMRFTSHDFTPHRIVSKLESDLLKEALLRSVEILDEGTLY